MVTSAAKREGVLNCVRRDPSLGRRIGEGFFRGNGAVYSFIYFPCVSVYLFIFGAV